VIRHAHHTIGRSSAFGGNKSGNPDSTRQERVLGRRRKNKRSVPAPATVLKYEVDLTFPDQAVSDQAVAFQSGSLDAVKGGFDSPDGVGPQFFFFFEPMAGSYVEV
jgi:hypothetical protein